MSKKTIGKTGGDVGFGGGISRTWLYYYFHYRFNLRNRNPFPQTGCIE